MRPCPERIPEGWMYDTPDNFLRKDTIPGGGRRPLRDNLLITNPIQLPHPIYL